MLDTFLHTALSVFLHNGHRRGADSSHPAVRWPALSLRVPLCPLPPGRLHAAHHRCFGLPPRRVVLLDPPPAALEAVVPPRARHPPRVRIGCCCRASRLERCCCWTSGPPHLPPLADAHLRRLHAVAAPMPWRVPSIMQQDNLPVCGAPSNPQVHGSHRLLRLLLPCGGGADCVCKRGGCPLSAVLSHHQPTV